MSDRPLGLRPQPATSHRVNSIAEFHQRMAMEPGGFKALNQADIRREIEARQNGAHNSADGNEHRDKNAHHNPDASVDLIQVKDEVIRRAAEATQSAGFIVDTLSLVVSKENPTSAATTLNPDTRQIVGLGTLGATRLAAPTTLTQDRIPRNKMMANGRRLVDLNHGADTALAASRRLQQEISAETKYWAEVQTVADAGFRIARLPEHHTMGVRFGFNSDKSDFANKDTAPMRRAADGSAQLALGPYGGGSQRIQVSILENATVVGRSSLPQPLADNSSLKDRVKEASETIFNQELWHEMNKEGRLMLDRNVCLEKSAITYRISTNKTMSIRLVSLGGADATASEPPRPEDDLAEALNTALALQLTSAHRFPEEDEGENEMFNAMHWARDEDEDVEYLILEPIISYFEHEKTVEQCTRLFSALVRPLCSAGLDSFVEISEKSLMQTLPPAKNRTVAATYALLTPSEVYFSLQIAPQCRLGIKCTSSATEGPQFAVSCEQPSQPNLANPLVKRCPPDPDGYDQISNLFEYLHDAVPRALAGYSGLIVNELTSHAQAKGGRPIKWVYTVSSKGLVDSDTGDYGIHFEFPVDSAVGRVIQVEGHFDENGEKLSRSWTWASEPGKHGAGNLEDVIKKILAGCAGS
ncbi:subunit 17 of mediator complex-domain-containing protein [Cladorrhinum sp. PSN259]|nr:subunit 17 of mediator complex-domain-containing protein [Cladorrhinum sp. PSN259]